jgi:hypothetical protein
MGCKWLANGGPKLNTIRRLVGFKCISEKSMIFDQHEPRERVGVFAAFYSCVCNKNHKIFS